MNASPAPTAPSRTTTPRQTRTRAPKPAPDPAASVLWSIADIAAYLSVSRRTLERQRSAGSFPRPDAVIGKLPRWRPATVQRWIDRQTGK